MLWVLKVGGVHNTGTFTRHVRAFSVLQWGGHINFEKKFELFDNIIQCYLIYMHLALKSFIIFAFLIPINIPNSFL